MLSKLLGLKEFLGVFFLGGGERGRVGKFKINFTYLPTVPIFDFQNLQKSGRPDFPEFQPVYIYLF